MKEEHGLPYFIASVAANGSRANGKAAKPKPSSSVEPTLRNGLSSPSLESKCQWGTDPRFPAGEFPYLVMGLGKISPHGELNGAKSVPVGFCGGGSGVPPPVPVPRGEPIVINLCSMFGFLVAISS